MNVILLAFFTHSLLVPWRLVFPMGNSQHLCLPRQHLLPFPVWCSSSGCEQHQSLHHKHICRYWVGGCMWMGSACRATQPDWRYQSVHGHWAKSEHDSWHWLWVIRCQLLMRKSSVWAHPQDLSWNWHKGPYPISRNCEEFVVITRKAEHAFWLFSNFSRLIRRWKYLRRMVWWLMTGIRFFTLMIVSMTKIQVFGPARMSGINSQRIGL